VLFRSVMNNIAYENELFSKPLPINIPEEHIQPQLKGVFALSDKWFLEIDDDCIKLSSAKKTLKIGFKIIRQHATVGNEMYEFELGSKFEYGESKILIKIANKIDANLLIEISKMVNLKVYLYTKKRQIKEIYECLTHKPNIDQYQSTKSNIVKHPMQTNALNEYENAQQSNIQYDNETISTNSYSNLSALSRNQGEDTSRARSLSQSSLNFAKPIIKEEIDFDASYTSEKSTQSHISTLKKQLNFEKFKTSLNVFKGKSENTSSKIVSKLSLANEESAEEEQFDRLQTSVQKILQAKRKRMNNEVNNSSYFPLKLIYHYDNSRQVQNSLKKTF